jgi:hypothetical protein
VLGMKQSAACLLLLVVGTGCDRLSGAGGSGASAEAGAAATATASGGPAGACTIQNGKTCFDYPGSSYTTTSVQAACTRLHGVYSPGTCPTTSRVGSCKIFVGQPSEQTVRYFTSGFTAEHAQTNCTAQSGAFTPN